MVSPEFDSRSTIHNRPCPEGRPMREDAHSILWLVRHVYRIVTNSQKPVII